MSGAALSKAPRYELMNYHVVAAEARADFRLWVRFADGLEGEVDLSDVAGRGVFTRWTDDPTEFAAVSTDPATRAPTWPGDLDVAPDALYAELAKLAESSKG